MRHPFRATRSPLPVDLSFFVPIRPSALSNRVFGKNILGEPPKTELPGTKAGLRSVTGAAVDQEEQAANEGAEAAEEVVKEEIGEEAPVGSIATA